MEAGAYSRGQSIVVKHRVLVVECLLVFHCMRRSEGRKEERFAWDPWFR